MSSTSKLGNILIFYYYQNLYYDYVDSNKATENFKFLLSNDTTDEINIYNTLIDINNILDYKGYRFFQANFDPDEKGTVLSVNHDYWGTMTCPVNNLTPSNIIISTDSTSN